MVSRANVINPSAKKAQPPNIKRDHYLQVSCKQKACEIDGTLIMFMLVPNDSNRRRQDSCRRKQGELRGTNIIARARREQRLLSQEAPLEPSTPCNPCNLHVNCCNRLHCGHIRPAIRDNHRLAGGRGEESAGQQEEVQDHGLTHGASARRSG